MNKPGYVWLAAAGLAFASAGFFAYRLLDKEPPLPQPSGLRAVSSALTPEQNQEAFTKLMQLTLPDLDGHAQAFSQWRGKVLVVNFWASWCAPCVQEMPAFSRLQERYAEQGVQFVGVGIDEVEHLRAFIRKTPVSYPLLVASLPISDTPALQIAGLPYTLVIARDGHIESRRLGRLDEAVLETMLQQQLTAR